MACTGRNVKEVPVIRIFGPTPAGISIDREAYFEPPTIYCTPCGARININAMYYTFGAGETRHYLCIPSYNDSVEMPLLLMELQFQRRGMRRIRMMRKLKNGGFNVTNVKLGSIKFVHYSMVGEMMVDKLSAFVQIVR